MGTPAKSTVVTRFCCPGEVGDARAPGPGDRDWWRSWEGLGGGGGEGVLGGRSISPYSMFETLKLTHT